MAGSEDALDFSIKLANSAAALASDDVQNICLKCEGDKVVRVGRASKNDVQVHSPGISWHHAELKLLPSEGEAGGEGRRRLGIRDISANGTGLQPPGLTLERLPKGEDVLLRDGSMIVLPMRLKVADDQRFFTVHFDDGCALPDAETPASAVAGIPPADVRMQTGAAEAFERASRASEADEVCVGAAHRDGLAAASPAAAAATAAPEVRLVPDALETPAAAADGQPASLASHEEPARKRSRVSPAVPRAAPPQESPTAGLGEVASLLRATREAQAFADAITPPLPPANGSVDAAAPVKPPASDEIALSVPPTNAFVDADALQKPPPRPPSASPVVRPPPLGARPKGGMASRMAANDIPPAFREKIQAGEAIIRDAREAEDRNQWGQAFDCYQRGLANFMEVLPKLGKDSPGGIRLRQQINGYLTKAGELKEKLERSKAFGCRKAPRPRGANRGLPME